MKTIQFIAVTLLVFSLWVAFALLAINPYLHPYVPGYQVGRPCGWEFVALFFSMGIAAFWIRKWPVPRMSPDSSTIALRTSLVVFLIFYSVLAIAIFVWQYSVWSANYV